jgi:hypothetical protein
MLNLVLPAAYYRIIFIVGSLVTVNSVDITPDPVEYPGIIGVSIDMDMKDMPLDAEVTIDFTKLGLFPIELPCILGLGACTYNVCEFMNDLPETFCEIFPPTGDGVCGCPLLAGHYASNTVTYELPDFGSLIGALLVGDYEGQVAIHAKGDETDKYACVSIEIEIVQ